MVIGYWLLVTGYSLLVTGYWLLVIGYWLLVIRYWLIEVGSGVARRAAMKPPRAPPVNPPGKAQ
jgi:hypothetical protein